MCTVYYWKWIIITITTGDWEENITIVNRIVNTKEDAWETEESLTTTTKNCELRLTTTESQPQKQ